MKYISLSLFLFLFLFFTGCSEDKTPSPENKSTDNQTTESKDESIDPAKGMMVDFDVKGDINGTIKAWYKGNKGKVDYNMDMAGRQVNSEIYTDNEWVYMVTNFEGNKTGIKVNAKKYATEGKDDQIDVTSFRDNLKNYKKIGTEEILGKQTDIYEIKPGNTISVYKEMVPLKMVLKNTTMTAKDYDTNLDLNDDFFKPPQDIQYMDAGDIEKGFKDMKGLDQKQIEEMMKQYKR